MADSIVGGLFGTPEAYQAQQNQQALAQAAQLGQLDPFSSARTSLIYGGRQLAGVLGGQDPQLQLLSQRNAVMREVNPNDPESIMAGAQRLAQFDPVGATALATMAREAEVKLSQVAKNLRESRAAGVGPEGMRAQREAQIQMALRTLKALPESPENKNAIQLLTDELTALQRSSQGGQPAIAKLQSYKESLVEQLGSNHPKVKEVEQAIKAEIQGKGTTVNVGLSTVDKESNMRKDFVTETKPITNVITAADKIEKLLTSNTALGDIIAKKQFNKLAGDNNISNKDVTELANYGDLGQRLAGTLNQFFEGKYTSGQREEAMSLVRQIKGDASGQYSTIQQDYRNRAKAENLPDKTSQFIAPDLAIKAQAVLPPEGTKLRNKKTGKIEIVRGGKLVSAE
jgi:hypothetical protein